MGAADKDDAELAALARSGDKQAFDALVARYQDTARRLAVGMVADEEMARDLVQEAMLQAYLSLAHLRDDRRFRGWLYGIVLNVCRSHLRDRKRTWLSLDAGTGGDRFEADVFSGVAPDPHRLAEERELQRRVLQAVNALSPKDREAAVLFYYEQRSLAEVAALSGVSVAAVKNRLVRVRKQLRERLSPVYPELDRERPVATMRSTMVKVTIDGVYEAPRGPFVTLVDEAVNRMLHIWIGAGEALAISILHDNLATQRPLTVDLMANLLQATGGKLEEARIEALRENTYYAVLKLRTGKKVRELDARPSDAIALALRTGSPIYVAREVLEQAGEDAAWIRYRRKPDYDESADYRFGEVSEVLPKLTERARNVFGATQEEAGRLGQSEVGTEHLLWGLLQEREGGGIAILERLGLAPDALRAELQPRLKPGEDAPEQETTYSSMAKRAIDLAWEESEAMKRDAIGTEHLLLGLLRVAHGRGGLTLRKLGADVESARAAACHAVRVRQRQVGE